MLALTYAHHSFLYYSDLYATFYWCAVGFFWSGVSTTSNFQVIAILDKIKNEKSGTDQNVEELDPSENEDDAEQLRSSPNEDDSDWEDEDPDDEGIIYVE